LVVAGTKLGGRANPNVRALSAADVLARAALRAVGPGASIEERLDALERAERGEVPKHRGTPRAHSAQCGAYARPRMPSQLNGSGLVAVECALLHTQLAVQFCHSMLRFGLARPCSSDQASSAGPCQPRLLQCALAAAAAADRPHSFAIAIELILQTTSPVQGGAAGGGATISLCAEARSNTEAQARPTPLSRARVGAALSSTADAQRSIRLHARTRFSRQQLGCM
jgi:hypothetical protein